jgi:hypothetical protein
VACHLADDFTFAPIVRPRRDDGTSADPPPAVDGRSDPQGPAEADALPGRTMKEALFGTRRRARLVPGAMVDESRDGGGGSR